MVLIIRPGAQQLKLSGPQPIAGVTCVRNSEDAKRVLDALMTRKGISYYASDTETVGVNPKLESPYGHGRIVCFSLYMGKQHNWGHGPRIWVDNLDGAEGLFELFEPFWRSLEHKKVWHNYSFDRGVATNHGIRIRGFGGDTMHMARLYDAGRRFNSLESLTEDLLDRRKVPMKERFGRAVPKKDGTPSKKIVTPQADELQRDPATFVDWVDYSTYDTEGLFFLRDALEDELRKMPWLGEKTQWDYYQAEWLPLGELLTDEEQRGITSDVGLLQEIEPIAQSDRDQAEHNFKRWAIQHCPDMAMANLSSDDQLQVFFFGGATNPKTQEQLERVRTFEVENVDGFIKEGRKKPNKKRPIKLTSLGLEPVEYTDTGWPAVGGSELLALAGDLSPEAEAAAHKAGKEPKFGLAYEFFGGEDAHEEAAAACRAIYQLYVVTRIDTLLSNFIIPLQRFPDVNGRIHTSMNLNTETGRLSARRPSLQNQPTPEKDIYGVRGSYTVQDWGQWKRYLPHEDLELILDTVRPRGDDEPTTLVVADYSQLELKLLAHLANCRSMIEAFAAGGDFHMRTAADMFEEVRLAIESGEVLLDWDKSKGPAPKPLAKELFKFQRGRGKTLNFSIAYGKTAHGFARDWNTTPEEAQKFIDLWYASRPEVAEWQKQNLARAYETGYTRTLMGRYRPVPDLRSAHKATRKHGERVTGNTPIQGGAADVVARAMILLDRDPWLRSHAFFQILQVHDEIILEGPRKFADEATERVKNIMEHPFAKPLRVSLDVEAHHAPTWRMAK